MLEALVFSLCMTTTEVACEKAATAYYYQKDLDKYAKYLEQEYRDYMVIVNIMAVLKEQRIVIPVNESLSVNVLALKDKIEIKYTF